MNEGIVEGGANFPTIFHGKVVGRGPKEPELDEPFLVVKKDRSIQKFLPRERNYIDRESLRVEGRGRGYSSKKKIEGNGARVIYRGIIANSRQESGEINSISPGRWARGNNRERHPHFRHQCDSVHTSTISISPSQFVKRNTPPEMPKQAPPALHRDGEIKPHLERAKPLMYPQAADP